MPRRVSIIPGPIFSLPPGAPEHAVARRWEVPGLSPRRVRVHLPSTFDGRTPRPVLYMFDGQNVFGDEGSYSGGWHVDRSVDRMAVRSRGVSPIVVAVDHGGEARLDELSAFHDGKRGGKAEALLAWMIEALMPAVSRSFPIVPPPYGAAVAGSSMGGLCALYAHFRHPQSFGGAIAMSPSLWFARRAVFDFVASRPKPTPSRVYLDCGALEAGGRMLTMVQSMNRHLHARGWDDDHLLFVGDPRGGHDERSWSRRFPKALRFMYR